MRELLAALIPVVEVRGTGNVRLRSYDELLNIGKFLRKNFPDDVGRNLGDGYAYVLVRRIALALYGEESQATGPLTELLSAGQIRELTERFVAWWDSVPRVYEFKFPLPQVKGLQLPMRFGPDVELRLEPWARDENAGGSSQLPAVPLRNLLAAALAPEPREEEFPTLCIRSRGIALLVSPEESACAHALHILKVFMELCYATKILDRHYVADAGNCKIATVLEAGENAMESRLALPAAISDRLRYAIAAKQQFEGGVGLGIVGRAMAARDQARASVTRVLARMQWAMLPEDRAEIHTVERLATRLATAASWMFDARADDYTANRVVRVAIALEALVGGEANEGVMSTLKNRLQYSIAKTVEDRREIAERFPEFYRLRSKVVHHGQVRLDEQGHELLRWAEDLVSRALRAELEILPDVEQQPAGV